MTSTPNTPNSENKPDWFSKTENNEKSNFGSERTPSKKLPSLKNKVVPLVAGLAIFGAAAAYGLSQKSGDDGGSNTTNANNQSAPQQENGLPAPTISSGPQDGPQGGPGHGVDPDGDNWTGSKRHPEGKFDPNHPRPPHGNDDERHEDDDD